MPIVTITVRKPKTSEFKNIVLDAVGAALVGAGLARTIASSESLSWVRMTLDLIRRFQI